MTKIKACTDKGVHNSVLKSFLELEYPKNSKILVLGAGYGALDEKLIGCGYKDITAIDIEDRYEVNNTNFIKFDLNRDFDVLFENNFDCIFVVEVIEHIENIFHMIRNISNIIHKDSIVFITTPNIHRKSARFLYFLTGKLDFFREKDIHESGHIMPIFDHIFRYALEKNNLYASSLMYNRKLGSESIIGRIKSVLFNMLFSFIDGNEGVVSIYKITQNGLTMGKKN
jgi:hypothetical protein